MRSVVKQQFRFRCILFAVSCLHAQHQTVKFCIYKDNTYDLPSWLISPNIVNKCVMKCWLKTSVLHEYRKKMSITHNTHKALYSTSPGTPGWADTRQSSSNKHDANSPPAEPFQINCVQLVLSSVSTLHIPSSFRSLLATSNNVTFGLSLQLGQSHYVPFADDRTTSIYSFVIVTEYFLYPVCLSNWQMVRHSISTYHPHFCSLSSWVPLSLALFQFHVACYSLQHYYILISHNTCPCYRLNVLQIHCILFVTAILGVPSTLRLAYD